MLRAPTALSTACSSASIIVTSRGNRGLWNRTAGDSVNPVTWAFES